MTRLVHNFDGGPDGTNLSVANSGQVPGNDPFNLVSTLGFTNVLQYADASALGRGTAEFVLKTATGATTSDCGVMWSTSMGSQTEVWFRFYIYLTQTPSVNGEPGDMCIFESDNGTVYTGFVYVGNTTRKVFLYDGPNSGNIGTTNVLPLNAWARIEGHFHYHATAGIVDLKLFLEADSDTPTETIGATGWDLNAASASTFAFGSPFNDTHKPTTYYSGLELNNTGWPGPAPWRPGKGAPSGMMTNAVAPHTFVVG
jgi:hypothetical protein